MSSDSIRFDNDYDESTVVMKPLVNPTYRDILGLPDHTEVTCMWPDSRVDGYDVDQSFKQNLIESMTGHGDSPDSPSGPLLVVAVTPAKMHPDILAALVAKS